MIAKRTNNFPDDYVKQIPILNIPTHLQQKKNVKKKNKKRNT